MYPSPSPYAPRAPSPSPYGAPPRAPSPLPMGYGPPSPIPPTQALQPVPATPSGQIQPGAITYTTSTSPDGRTTYHPFKAVPVSYQTSNGVVSGIQWVPAEASSVLPAGAQPANADFVSSWNQKRDDKALKEWQKDEEHRIRKEEKEAAKRLKKEKERQAREREARAMPGNPYGAYSNPMNDLERRMDGVDLGRGRNAAQGEYNRSPYQHPIAPPSPNMGATNLGYPQQAPVGFSNAIYPPSGHGPDIYRAPSPYRGVPGGPPEPAILSRSRAPSPNPMGAHGGGIYGQRAPSPSPGAMPQYGGNRSRNPSPNPGGVSGPYPPALPRSRAASPLPGAPPPYGQPGHQYPNPLPRSPRVGGGAPLGGPEQPPMLPPPDGFSRPANLAQSYTFFDTMKIQDMDDFYENMPRMPKVLVPHDVYHEDWIRFIQDLALAWAGKLPTTDPNRPSRSSLVAAELIDLWNNSFFAQRGVEIVLFKGHERRSGPWVGQVDHNLPGFRGGTDSDSSDSLSSDDSSSLSDDKYGRGAGAGAGGGYYGSYAGDAKRRKAERKAEKKRKNKEKKARRRARERERTYALYISCITPRDGSHGGPY